MHRDDKPKLLNRLKRIEGQVRGVTRMVDEDRYCIDIMTQLAAVRAAIVRGDAAEQRRKAGELIELLERSAR
jgi:CsoR family transcriptional regulator, copper-sensing transcriptional repressor